MLDAFQWKKAKVFTFKKRFSESLPSLFFPVPKLESCTVRIQMCVGVQVSCSHLGGHDKIGLGHFSPQRQR